ncbi:ABC transporter permease [Flavilitoribacter nigricans]|uniref:ABC transporter permease n=1 Tax=Flavilitoribacter nigricans (strain ATCC 23147 / DSM 23189 / NBRC 102662 / NCIMB 1420 / SS-2) TaxID=1122177 RepID=A0A2D0N8L9_FLAN2|nr:ABC transporter permease [Flavilitoribacter nigricans]PHN04825.1 ABC transporter permease [Flavilitoribacter nigricans DSM 23189 = NBRC 102662]
MLKNYLKIAWKVLGRNKFFTFVSLFGISITLAILMVVTTFMDHILNPKYPEVNRDRSTIVRRVQLSTEDGNSMSISAASFYFMDRYVRKLKTPELVAIASNNNSVNTFVDGRKLSLQLIHTCENFWKVNEFKFLEGGPYTRQHIEDNAFVAVISEATRDAYFGEGTQAVGKWIEADNTRYEVVGVVKNVPIFQNFSHSDLYAPYNTSKIDLQQYGFTGNYVAMLMGHDESDIPAIKAEFDEMVAGIEIPKSEWYDKLDTYTDTYLGVMTRQMFRSEKSEEGLFYTLLFAAMFLFMLLPALNLVNLNSSRIMERASEIGVRKAFGATSAVLTVQFIVENILLSLLGGAIGLVMAWGILELFEATGWLKHAELSINFNVFLIGLLLTVFFGFLSGVLPALRMSKMQIVHAIKGDV